MARTNCFRAKHPLSTTHFKRTVVYITLPVNRNAYPFHLKLFFMLSGDLDDHINIGHSAAETTQQWIKDRHSNTWAPGAPVQHRLRSARVDINRNIGRLFRCRVKGWHRTAAPHSSWITYHTTASMTAITNWTWWMRRDDIQQQYVVRRSTDNRRAVSIIFAIRSAIGRTSARWLAPAADAGPPQNNTRRANWHVSFDFWIDARLRRR
jgi:hypothetical protein